MKKNSLKLLGSALATVFLASCGGESSNLPDPERPIVSTCTADNCVTGIFVADGVVEGLNYECGNIRSKTTYQGEFSCPLDSATNKVTFVISHSETGNRVTLGEYVFLPVYTTSTTYTSGTPTTISTYEAVPSQLPDKRIYVTPRELTNEQFTDGFSDRALSITALLHSLDTDFSVGAAASPANIVNLSEDNKRTFLTGLVTSGTDPSIVTSTDTNFRDLVNPGLEAISVLRKLPASGADMAAYIPIAQQATHALAAGVYRSNEPQIPLYSAGGLISGFKLLDETLGVSTSFTRMPFAAKSSNNTFYGYMSFGVDRSGRLFGFGAAEMRLAGVVQNDPLALIPAPNQAWPNSGNLTALTWGLQNSNGTPRSESIVMKQGVVDRGSMANDPEVYKTYFGVDTSVDARLGRWEMKDGGSVLLGGSDLLPPRMELRHSYNAFPILNPEVWNGVSFPIHLKAVITEGCETTSCPTVEVNFSVLADGNIISDRDANCASVNAQLKDAANTQELPIGVVTRAFVNDGAGATGGHYLIPMILIPSELISTTEIRQIEIGTTAPARLRVDASTHFGKIYSNSSEVEDLALDWVDFYFYQKRFGPVAQAGSAKETGKMTTEIAACAP